MKLKKKSHKNSKQINLRNLSPRNLRLSSLYKYIIALTRSDIRGSRPIITASTAVLEIYAIFHAGCFLSA